MKRILIAVILCLAVSNLAEAQDIKRWTLGLHFAPETISTKEDSHKLLPYVAYNFNSWLSAGVELNLPLKDRGAYSSTGAEVFVAFRSPRLYGFRLSFSPVLGGSIIGAYKYHEQIETHFYATTHSTSAQRQPESSWIFEQIKHRWYIGLRPTLSYDISEQWSLSLSYAFYGYRSHKRLDELHYIKGKVRPEGAWGFTTSTTYSSGLRLGISYSF